MIGLDQTASVYTPGSDGDFTVLNTNALACRLAHFTTGATSPADERADVSPPRRLLWGADYTMPDVAQVEVEGRRWNIEPHTVEAIRGLGGSTEYQRATVVIAI